MDDRQILTHPNVITYDHALGGCVEHAPDLQNRANRTPRTYRPMSNLRNVGMRVDDPQMVERGGTGWMTARF